jgi:flagellar hook protein FlgE
MGSLEASGTGVAGMQPRSSVYLLAVLTLTAAACNSARSLSEREQPVLSEVLTQPADGQCPLGGERLRLGEDDNGDGRLQDDEVQASTLVCRREGAPLDAGAADPAPDRPPAACTPLEKTETQLIGTAERGDLAIVGEGFLVLRVPGDGGVQLYRRSGSFHIDADAYVVDAAGGRLQGYTEGQGSLLTHLRLMPLRLPASATTRVQVAVNLDANALQLSAFQHEKPGQTSNFSVSIVIFDTQGNGHQLTIYFARLGQGWQWHAMVDGRNIDGATAGVPLEGGHGALTFTKDGALADDTAEPTRWSFVGARPDQAVIFDFGTSIQEGGTGLERTSNFGAPHVSYELQQDGRQEGWLTAMAVDEEGVISAVFSNDQRLPAGQLALALFPGDPQLTCAGGDRWAVTMESSVPRFARVGSAGRGSVVSGGLLVGR